MKADTTATANSDTSEDRPMSLSSSSEEASAPPANNTDDMDIDALPDSRAAEAVVNDASVDIDMELARKSPESDTSSDDSSSSDDSDSPESDEMSEDETQPEPSDIEPVIQTAIVPVPTPAHIPQTVVSQNKPSSPTVPLQKPEAVMTVASSNPDELNNMLEAKVPPCLPCLSAKLTCLDSGTVA